MEEQKNEKPVNEKKQELIRLSLEARELKKQMVAKFLNEGDNNKAMFWELRTVNSVIAEQYRTNTGAKEFKTYKQWKEAGFQVLKGSKAFVLWAQKEKVFKKDEGGTPTEQTDYEFFPMAFLFSDLQVEKSEVNELINA